MLSNEVKGAGSAKARVIEVRIKVFVRFWITFFRNGQGIRGHRCVSQIIFQIPQSAIGRAFEASMSENVMDEFWKSSESWRAIQVCDRSIIQYRIPISVMGCHIRPVGGPVQL